MLALSDATRTQTEELAGTCEAFPALLQELRRALEAAHAELDNAVALRERARLQAIGARLLVDAEPGERVSRQRALVAQRAALVARLAALEEELTAGL